jgi:hypothetical protein
VASDISLAVDDGDSVTTTDSTPDSVPRLTDSTAGPVITTDPLTAIGIQTLSQAVEMLREDVEQDAIGRIRLSGKSRSSGNWSKKDASGSTSYGPHSLTDGLYTELADARTTAMIRTRPSPQQGKPSSRIPAGRRPRSVRW